MAMKISAIVLIGIVLISIYIKDNDKGLVIGRTPWTLDSDNSNSDLNSHQDFIKKSINTKSYRILEYPDQTLNLKSFLNSIDSKQNLVEDSSTFLLVFWATWCPNCKENLLNLNENLNNTNIRVWAVNLDTKEDLQEAKKLWTALNLPFDLIYDPERKSLNKFNIEILPTYSFIKNNKYLYRIEGQPDWSKDDFQKILKL